MTDYRRSLRAFGAGLELLGAVGAALLMCGLFVFGFVEIAIGLVTAYRHLWNGTGPADFAPLVNAVLSGLELFFLAPLPFLTFFSASRLFRAIVTQDDAAIRSSHLMVSTAKRLITSLMIGAIATEMIHRITSGAGLTALSTAAATALIVSLGFYYWLAGKTPAH